MPLQTLTQELARQIAADYPTLQSLNLSRNALNDVRHLKLLPRSLTQLDLGSNRLSLLPDELGTWIPELRLLRLRANALESLRPLVGCKQLQTLDVGANRVALVSELRFLQPLTQLRHLALDGNPLADAPTYRREVLGLLPQLQSLDGQEVTAAERLYAKLQLKTQLGGGDTGTSPAPSPRLLTPDSFRSQRNSEQEVATTLRVEVNGEMRTERDLDDTSWEECRNHRIEFHESDGVARLPSPLVLAPTTTLPAGTSQRPSESERAQTFQQTKKSDRRSNCYHRQNYKASAITPQSGRDNFQTVVTRTREDRIVAASDTGTREMLLKSRVEALEAILAVHDKTVKHTLTRFGEQNGGSGLSVAGKNGSNVAPTVEAAAAVYTRLLAAWREKCVALMVQAQSNGLANETLIHEYQHQETKICEDLARCEEKLEMWQQRAADFEAQRDLEVVTTRQAENQRAQANAKAVQAVRGLALEREKLQRFAETVVRFTGGVVRDKLEQLQSGSARLEALERRLFLAKERVEVAATLVAHRETRLRNSEAALEAERRVWVHRLEQISSMKPQDQEMKSENNGDVSNAVVRPPADGKLLRPVTEAALRALFHRLDSYDTGLVRSQVLLQALRRGDSGVLSAIGGPKKLSKLVSHVEASISKLTLAGRPTKTLTWGEFLLFFIPENSVSLAASLQGLDDSENGTMVTLEKSIGACSLCAAVKSNGLPKWPFASPYSTEPANDTDGDVKSVKKRKERKTLETLSHAELVQQNAVLLTDRERLRRLLARDAHDLQNRVRGVRREWEEKTSELVHQKEMFQRKLDKQTEVLHDTQKQCEKAESAHDSAVLEIQTLREQFFMQEQEFELQKKKLEAESTERLQHEQEIWQTEIQDMRLTHSLLQADHSKQQMRIRQLERDLARQKEALLAHETERVASLEAKVRHRDTELSRLRRERNTILNSLREKEQKLALATAPVEPTPTESIAIQTERSPPLMQKTVASQTTPIKPPTTDRLNCELDKSRSGRMSINEISAPSSLEGGARKHNDRRLDGVKATHLTPEDVNLRLQKLQSLTESLLAD